MTRDEILTTIREKGGLADEATAIRVARAVVCSLRDRLGAEEAEGVVAALRDDLPELLACEAHPHRAPERAKDRLTEPEVADRVCSEAGLSDRAAARRLIRVVLAALASRLSGEAEAPEGNVARAIGELASKPPHRGGKGER